MRKARERMNDINTNCNNASKLMIYLFLIKTVIIIGYIIGSIFVYESYYGSELMII